MPAGPLIDALCESNDISNKPRLPENPRLGDTRVHWPETLDVHDTLLKGAIERESNVWLLSPTLRHEYLEILTLSALFKLMSADTDRNRVLVFSRDAHVRERYKELRPGHRRPWSKERFPLATIKPNGEVNQKTTSRGDEGRPPRALFSKHLTHLPDESVASEIGCVIHDETITYRPNRWNRFQQWLDENDIPSVIYCLHDPLGPTFGHVSEDASGWAWPPALLDAVVDESTAADGGVKTVPEVDRQTRVTRQLQNHVNGVSREVHVVEEGEIVDDLADVWSSIEELGDVNDDLQSDILDDGINDLKMALNVISNIVASMGNADRALGNQWETIAPSGWLDRLGHNYEKIRDDDAGGPAHGVYGDAVRALEDVHDQWEDYDLSETKRGHLYRLLHGALDADESVLVVVPSDGDRSAVELDLEARGGPLYDALGEELGVISTGALPTAPPADRVILVGPPAWRDRWILRTNHAPEVTVLAYEHQLPLLRYQYDHLDDTLREVTDRELYREAAETANKDEEWDAPVVDGVSVNVPMPKGRSEDEDTSERESSIAEGYDVVEEHEPMSVDEIIDSLDTSSDPSVPSSSGSESGDGRSGSVKCLRLVFDDGRSMPIKRGSRVHVVDGDRGGTVSKYASKVQPGDTIVHVRQTEQLRQQLYDLIKRRGDDKVIMRAERWKIRLEQALDETGDDFDEFKERMREAGADHGDDTYRRWYNLEIDYPRTYDDLPTIAEAYDLTVVKENSEEIWEATQDIKTTYMNLLRELRKQAYRVMAGDDPEQVVLSKDWDIRLADFDVIDEDGQRIVEPHTVVDIHEDRVAHYRLKQIEAIDLSD